MWKEKRGVIAMKKNTVRWLIVLAVVIIVYNVVVFVAPINRSAVFFLSWVFSLIAILAQVYVIHTAFYRGKGIKSKFYGWPIAKIGAVYLIIQIVFGLMFMAVGDRVRLWIPLVLYVLLLGVSAIGFIAADTMRDEVNRQDEKHEGEVIYMRTLYSRVISMSKTIQDSQVRTALEKFSEDLRFSDPVSSETLKDIESDLTACIDALQQAISESDYQNALTLIQKVETILEERNRFCKLNK